MVNQMLIAKDKLYLAKRGGGVIASVKELNDLDYGALAIITEVAGVLTLVTAANTATAFVDSKYFQIAVGGVTAAQGAVLGKKIERTASVVPNYFSYGVYAAPIAEIMYLGDNNTDVSDLALPSSFVTGDVLEVQIMDTSNAYIPAKKTERYSYAAKVSDTEATALAGIVAKINEGTLMTALAIDAGTANAGIKLTGKTAGARYKVSVGGVLVDAPIYTAFNDAGYALGAPKPVAPFAGNGTYAQVMEEANYTSTVWGNTSRNYLPELFTAYAGILDAVEGTGYNTYTFNYSKSGSYGLATRESVPQTFKLVVPTAPATLVLATINAIFTAAMSSTSQAAESGAIEENEA